MDVLMEQRMITDAPVCRLMQINFQSSSVEHASFSSGPAWMLVQICGSIAAGARIDDPDGIDGRTLSRVR
jgi:hypothetical protein